MTIPMNDSAKSLAIATHSAQADEFASAYAVSDPFASCFNYSRFRLDEILWRLLPPPSAAPRVLDVGCGTGHQMRALTAKGYEVSGVDGSEEMLRYAEQNNPGATLRRGDIESLPFEDSSFDAVISIEVLRYVPDPLQSLREIVRVLRPGGTCIVTAAPLFNANGYAAINRIAERVPLPGFVRLRQFFTTSWGVRSLLVRAGLRDVEIHGVYFGPINWVERLLPFAIGAFLRLWLPVDRLLADLPLIREFSNMFVVRASK